MNFISFPGLGIDKFQINKIAFSVFGIDITWYGIIICVGLILGVLYSVFRATRNEGLKSDTVIDLAFFLVIFGVIGARLYYVIFKFGDYIRTNEDGSFNFGKTLLAMINIREGGLAIYGAIIAGFFTILLFAKIKKISSLKILDFVSPAVMIGQIIGRWGNFMNAEAHGYETNLPWRMGIYEANGFKYYHPTFLYESLWNLIGFLIINAVYKKKKFNGQIFFMYIAWYGLGRAFIEGLRTDSLMLGPVRISQLIGALAFAAGVAFLIVFSKRSRAEAVSADGVNTLDIDNSEANHDSYDGVIVSDDPDGEISDTPKEDVSSAEEIDNEEIDSKDEKSPLGNEEQTDGDDNGEDN